jgi:hypothetical protein
MSGFGFCRVKINEMKMKTTRESGLNARKEP